MSLAQRWHRPMIDLGSIAGLHAHQHELHCYCAYRAMSASTDDQFYMRTGLTRAPC